MSFTGEQLYDLLPAIYRIRDTEQGEPLRALMSVVADQLVVLEEDLAQLYDDQFIETCADWVVPYIGDLIGYRALHTTVPVGNPRAEVAHTIAFRRRKGTATMLEQLARDVTDWNARAVEFFQLLAWTQNMNHVRPACYYAPNLRRWETLERLNTAFDTVAHTVDVRHIGSGEGKYNIPNIGIFLWRLNTYPLSQSPAIPAVPGDTQRFRFDPLGRDTQLFTQPIPEDQISHLAEPVNVPQPLSRSVLDQYLSLYYGSEKSMFLAGIDIGAVRACNLSDVGSAWSHIPPSGKVAIDPVLGRIAFGDPQNQPPLVTFHYGFSVDAGGGEYDRAGTIDPLLLPVLSIPTTTNPNIQGALNQIATGGAVEIANSDRYLETPNITVQAGLQNKLREVELRSDNRHRATLEMSGSLEITGGEFSVVTLNGLLITGGALHVPATAGNKLQSLRLQHCTLVPDPQAKSGTICLAVEIPDITVEIDHCIVVGSLHVAEGARLKITDSIVDAMNETFVAFANTDDISAGGTLQITASTVIGKIHTRELTLASNSIFMADLQDKDPWLAEVGSPICSEKKQSGCVRFSYVPLASIVPRKHRCQPASQSDALRVRPQFTSLRFGDPGYCQLSTRTATEIRTGSDDEAEMGAFHSLYQPQREINLRIRLEEYLRFGLEAGVFYET